MNFIFRDFERLGGIEADESGVCGCDRPIRSVMQDSDALLDKDCTHSNFSTETDGFG